MKLLSLLLPTYNRLNRFKELVEYLQNEKIFEYDDLEIIISNNCSTDGTAEYIDSLDQNKFTIFNQESNLGLIGNIRFLITKASGKYIWVMGDNDKFYDHVIDQVLSTIKANEDVSHIFINYSVINGDGSIIKDKMYTGYTKIYPLGKEMFYELTEQVDLGILMFISANIYRKDIVDIVNGIVDAKNESENLALPLGYSLYSAKTKNICIGKVLVANEVSTTSTWINKEVLVYCRDMLAMYDIIAETFDEYKELRDFYIKNLPSNFPEYRYLIRGRNFKKNNYAMEFYKRYYPYKIILDIIIFPFSYFKYFIGKWRKRQNLLLSKK